MVCSVSTLRLLDGICSIKPRNVKVYLLKQELGLYPEAVRDQLGDSETGEQIGVDRSSHTPYDFVCQD
jgi:hypothetical protein